MSLKKRLAQRFLFFSLAILFYIPLWVIFITFRFLSPVDILKDIRKWTGPLRRIIFAWFWQHNKLNPCEKRMCAVFLLTLCLCLPVSLSLGLWVALFLSHFRIISLICMWNTHEKYKKLQRFNTVWFERKSHNISSNLVLFEKCMRLSALMSMPTEANKDNSMRVNKNVGVLNFCVCDRNNQSVKYIYRKWFDTHQTIDMNGKRIHR